MTGFGQRFLERHPDLVPFANSNEADEHAARLETAGLGVLNEKALSTREIGPLLDLLAEHTTGVMLVRQGFTDLTYEPQGTGTRRADFVGCHAGQRYAVEVKRMTSSQHDALNSKVMRTLNLALKADKRSVVVSLGLTESFTKADINRLLQHVKATLQSGKEGGRHGFPSDQAAVATYILYPAPTRPHAIVGLLWHDGVRDVTGGDMTRVQRKIRDAYGQFDKANPDVTNVVLLLDDLSAGLIAVSEALYGTECFHMPSEMTFRRPDGLLSQGQHSALHAVLHARRAGRVFAPYDLTLFEASTRVPREAIAQAFGVERVLGPGDLPGD